MNSSAGREGSRLKVEDVVEQDLQPSILSSGAAERLSSLAVNSSGYDDDSYAPPGSIS
jgi:hypothetical protein